MVNFNFDSEFFRKVICECALTEKIPSLSQMIKEATEAFYDEFDYYPDIGVSAPGVFTILGDHLEYVEGKLVQAVCEKKSIFNLSSRRFHKLTYESISGTAIRDCDSRKIVEHCEMQNCHYG